MAKVRSEKQLGKIGPRGLVPTSGSSPAMLGKEMHTETVLTHANNRLTSDSCCVSFRSIEAGDSTTNSRTAQQKRPLLSVLSDRLSHAPVIMARRNDSNSSLSRNQLSQTDAPSRLRTNVNSKQIRTKPSIRRTS